MGVLYIRTSDEVETWLRELAGRSGLSMAKTADILFRNCMRDGAYEVSLVPQVSRADPA